MACKIAYSSGAYARVPLPIAVRRIARLDFDGVEIPADDPHLFPEAGLRDHGALARALDGAGLVVSNVNASAAQCLAGPSLGDPGAGPTLVDTDPRRRALRVAHILETVVQTALLGGGVMSLGPGPRLPGVSDRVAGRLLRASLEPVAVLAEAKRVRVGVEIVTGSSVGDAASLRRLLADLRSPWLGASLDLGSGVVCGDDPARTIEAVGDRLWNCHIGDVDVCPRSHRGDDHLRRLRRALDAIDYRRFLTLVPSRCNGRPDAVGRKWLKVLRRIFG